MSGWKRIAIPSELYHELEIIVKSDPEYRSVSELVRRIISQALKRKEAVA